MDDIDRAILRELQVDGRIPYADLGPKVGLSPSAARLRLQRLIDTKAVQVVGVTDPMTMAGRRWHSWACASTAIPGRSPMNCPGTTKSCTRS